LRSLTTPEPGRAIAYIDWTSAEVGITAALSEDRRLQTAYESGDVYMAFAVDAKAAPSGATKDTHGKIRDVFKRVMLAVQYGQRAAGLARTLGIGVWRAKELLDLHRRLYGWYWQWNAWTLQRANFERKIQTVFRWPMHVTRVTKQTTIANFPMQAHGSEMLRWACVYATEQGVEVHVPVQDALLIGGTAEGIGGVAELTRAAMAKASDLVLGGFVLRTDVNVVRYPDRYSDKRGAAMRNRVLCLLSSDMAA